MSIRLIVGDCRSVLRSLPAESVDCIVTSPPYYGLRDYGVTGQIGLEETPDGYVKELVEAFRECRRVLKSSGTLWLNLGDSYASSQANGGQSDFSSSGLKRDGRSEESRVRTLTQNAKELQRERPQRTIKHGVKPKDLLGIPWRVAFALQADGWYLRQDIIWSKPNPMPESVRDRCTKAHEYIFMMSKRERYWFDQEAIKEEGCAAIDLPRRHGNGETVQAKNVGGYRVGGTDVRNKRSVWEVATQPFAKAHFATFPPKLIEPCIKAGCPEKCCAKCGAPWARQTEVSRRDTRPNRKSKFGDLSTDIRSTGEGNVAFGLARRTEATVTTVGWTPSCSCNAATVPGVTLDPFGGAGTTGLVADRLQRNAILIELNPQYAEMAEERIAVDAGILNTGIHIEAIA